jgi:hypothetical protein
MTLPDLPTRRLCGGTLNHNLGEYNTMMTTGFVMVIMFLAHFSFTDPDPMGGIGD